MVQESLVASLSLFKKFNASLSPFKKLFKKFENIKSICQIKNSKPKKKKTFLNHENWWL